MKKASIPGDVRKVRILPPRQNGSLANTEFVRLLSSNTSAGVSAGVSKTVLFKPEIPMALPYKLPRLIIPGAHSKDQRWVIKYYVWNADINKMVMVRDLSINKAKNLETRKEWAKNLIKKITADLKDGKHINTAKLLAMQQDEVTKQQAKSIGFKDALEVAMKSKRSQNLKSLRNYENAYSKIIDWLALHPTLKKLPLQSITRNHIEDFLESLSSEVTLSGRSYNNYLSLVKHLFKVLMDKDYIVKNPCDAIEPRRQAKGRNLAYTLDQQKKLIEFMQERYPNLLAFCQVMYYTLMRTNEISNMQAWWIGAYNPNQIYVPKEFSKNGQEKHITIPPQLERIIRDNKWRELPRDTYIFSSGFRPGKNAVQAKMHANKYRRWVLQKLDFSGDYTMYSWKHTGVVFLYRNNVPRVAIRMQAGFLDDKSFETYLKSLGLFENEQLITNYPSLPSIA